jgi:hypothetical protein
VAIRFDYLRGGRQVSSRESSLFQISSILAQPVLTGSTFPCATVLATIALLSTLPIVAQYPVQVTKPSQDTPEMRAVAVLEWTGDEDHPKASRLVPVTVYDGQELQDGDIYLARPAPLALGSEVEYELKDDGKTVGLFDIDNAGQEQGSWVGFGVWKPLSKPKPARQVARAANKEVWGNDDQADRPVLHRKHSSDSSSASDSSDKAPDPDRPTLHKKDSSDSSSDSSTDNSASSVPPDPDRPTLHKDASSDDSTSGSGSSSDADRPKLKRNSKTPVDVGYVDSVPDATDPDRPHLLRGRPSGGSTSVLPTLMGFPADMHQAVAVSDARSRPDHVWRYSWANPDDEAKMKAELEDIAQKATGLTSPPSPPATAKKTDASKRKKAAPPPAPPPSAPLQDEQFRVFELAYGSGATMVLSAHTGGTGVKEKFVTLVAQPDLYGNVLVLVKSVTDAAHLDDTPRMRLVDAVDAMADNRGELLFELRGATQRQFALYRVLRGQADRLFLSGPEGIAPPPTHE